MLWSARIIVDFSASIASSSSAKAAIADLTGNSIPAPAAMLWRPTACSFLPDSVSRSSAPCAERSPAESWSRSARMTARVMVADMGYSPEG